jgi:phosphoribosylamine-glycine ligase
MVFQAGTGYGNNGELVTSGGRVMAVSAYGNDLAEASAQLLYQCWKNLL